MSFPLDFILFLFASLRYLFLPVFSPSIFSICPPFPLTVPLPFPHNDPVLQYSVFYNMTFFGTEPDP